MKKSKGQEAIEKLAAQRGISADEIRGEISLAIDIAMAASNPDIKAFYAQMPKHGEKPSPEELIGFLIEILASYY